MATYEIVFKHSLWEVKDYKLVHTFFAILLGQWQKINSHCFRNPSRIRGLWDCSWNKITRSILNIFQIKQRIIKKTTQFNLNTNWRRFIIITFLIDIKLTSNKHTKWSYIRLKYNKAWLTSARAVARRAVARRWTAPERFHRFYNNAFPSGVLRTLIKWKQNICRHLTFGNSVCNETLVQFRCKCFDSSISCRLTNLFCKKRKTPSELRIQRVTPPRTVFQRKYFHMSWVPLFKLEYHYFSLTPFLLFCLCSS